MIGMYQALFSEIEKLRPTISAIDGLVLVVSKSRDIRLEDFKLTIKSSN